MKPIEISRREVMNNIIRFKNAFSEKENVWMNTHTGDIRFGGQVSPDWKQVQLHQAAKQNKLRVELLAEAEEFEPFAWRIAQETVRVLNEIIAEYRVQGSVQAALQDLSHIKLVEPKGWLEDFPGWQGNMDRVAAERLLQRAPRGTYLLREGDELTRDIATQLSRENGVSVTAYVCTTVESEHKISDILILHTSRGWTLYNDNPDLSDAQYAYSPSPQGVLHHMQHRARHPLS